MSEEKIVEILDQINEYMEDLKESAMIYNASAVISNIEAIVEEYEDVHLLRNSIHYNGELVKAIMLIIDDRPGAGLIKISNSSTFTILAMPPEAHLQFMCEYGHLFFPKYPNSSSIESFLADICDDSDEDEDLFTDYEA